MIKTLINSFTLLLFLYSCDAQKIPLSRSILSEQHPFVFSNNRNLLLIKEENRLFKYSDSLFFVGTFSIPYTIEALHETMNFYLIPVGQEEKYEKTYIYDKEFSVNSELENFQIVSVFDFEKNIVLAYHDTMINNSRYFFNYYLYDLSMKDTVFSFPENHEVMTDDGIYSYTVDRGTCIINGYNNIFQIDTTFEIKNLKSDFKIIFINKDYYLINNENYYELCGIKNRNIRKYQIDGINVQCHFDKTSSKIKLYYWLKTGSIYTLTESVLL
jgi:hypothetical protein